MLPPDFIWARDTLPPMNNTLASFSTVILPSLKAWAVSEEAIEITLGARKFSSLIPRTLRSALPSKVSSNTSRYTRCNSGFFPVSIKMEPLPPSM